MSPAPRPSDRNSAGRADLNTYPTPKKTSRLTKPTSPTELGQGHLCAIDPSVCPSTAATRCRRQRGCKPPAARKGEHHRPPVLCTVPLPRLPEFLQFGACRLARDSFASVGLLTPDPVTQALRVDTQLPGNAGRSSRRTLGARWRPLALRQVPLPTHHHFVWGLTPWSAPVLGVALDRPGHKPAYNHSEPDDRQLPLRVVGSASSPSGSWDTGPSMTTRQTNSATARTPTVTSGSCARTILLTFQLTHANRRKIKNWLKTLVHSAATAPAAGANQSPWELDTRRPSGDSRLTGRPPPAQHHPAEQPAAQKAGPRP